MAAPRRRSLTARARGLVLRAAVTLAPLLLLAGCRNLDRFDTEKPAAYCGALVSGASFHSGFIRTGDPPTLELRLELDTSSLAERPGSLTSNDSDAGFCRPAPLFSDTPLRAIPELLRDSLSQLEFGQGHEHDFFAWVDSSCQGTMLAVVSLLTDGAVEVRLLKPGPDISPLADEDGSKRPGFALFHLERNEKGCGF